MFRSILVIMTLILAVSCEKSITFTPRESESSVVIEATIENDQAPVVFLSRSLGYFNSISPELLANSFIRNADVSVSNGSKIHKLKEYSTEVFPGYKIYYYSVDSLNPTTAFSGELGREYSLSVIVDGKEFTANTTIPFLNKTIDSLWWMPSPENPDTTKVILMTKTQDPPGYGNYIRYFTSTNGGPFFPGFTSVFDDQIIDGKTYSIQVERGINRNEEIDLENYSFFNRGDTVILKLANIDKATFDFWRTMEFSYSSIGNPFSSPTKVLSNIKGGGLGYFGGYGVQYKTLIIPK